MSHGNIQKLLAPIDSRGARCGMDSDVADKPYLVFFDLSKCLSPGTPIVGCPTPQARYQKSAFRALPSMIYWIIKNILQCLNTYRIMMYHFFSTLQVCVEKCPTETILFQTQMTVTNFAQFRSSMVCMDNIKPNTFSEAMSLIDNGKCAPYVLQSQAGNIIQFYYLHWLLWKWQMLL